MKKSSNILNDTKFQSHLLKRANTREDIAKNIICSNYALRNFEEFFV